MNDKEQTEQDLKEFDEVFGGYPMRVDETNDVWKLKGLTKEDIKPFEPKEGEPFKVMFIGKHVYGPVEVTIEKIKK